MYYLQNISGSAYDPGATLTEEYLQYAVAYAMYQRGDMTYDTYMYYKRKYWYTYFDTYSQSNINPVDDNWGELDSVGDWIPPSTSDPDGHWEGYIHTTAGSESWNWIPGYGYCDPTDPNSGQQNVTCVNDQYGHSHLYNHNLQESSNNFRHVLEYGDFDRPVLVGDAHKHGWFYLPDTIPYAVTEKPWSNIPNVHWTPQLHHVLNEFYLGPGFYIWAETSTTNSSYNVGYNQGCSLVFYGSPQRVLPHDPTDTYEALGICSTRADNIRIEVMCFNGSRFIIAVYVKSRSQGGLWSAGLWVGDHVNMIHPDALWRWRDYIEANWGWEMQVSPSLGEHVITNPGRNTDGVWWLQDVFEIPVFDSAAGAGYGILPNLNVTLCATYDSEGHPPGSATQKQHVNSFSTTNYTKQNITTLFTKAPGNPYPPEVHLGSSPLYINSDSATNDNIPLFLKTAEPQTGNMPLFIYGSLTSLSYDAEVIPLYMPGPSLSSNAWISLYTSGDPAPANGNTLSFVHDSTGLEDFTAFTVDDGAGQYTDNYSYSRIRATVDDNSSSRLYQTNAVGHFNVSFETRFELYIEDEPTTMSLHPIAFTNSTAASSTWASSVEALTVECYNDSGTTKLRLKEYLYGDVSLGISVSEQVRYYIKIVRLSNKVTMSIYTDSGYSILLSSVSVYMTSSTVKYQYCIVGDTLDVATGDSMKYMMDNLKYFYIFMEGNTTLYTAGRGVHNDAVTLYIEGSGDSINSYFPLQIYGTDITSPPTYWTERAISLFLKDTQSSVKGRTLFIKNTETSVSFDPGAALGLKLVVKGRGDILTNSLPLVVFNEQIAATMPLFIQGPEQVYHGSEGTTANLPIYIYRPDESAVMPLVIYSDTPSSNSYIPMFINGVLGVPSAQMPLVLPSAISDLNSYTNLFVQGAVPITSSLPLVLGSTTGPLTGSIPLFVQHGGGLTNTYADLYIFGAYSETAFIPLVMADVVEIPVDNIILYTQGY
jgi:hypothetical protein